MLIGSPHFTVSKNVFLSECKDKRNKLCKCSVSYDIKSPFRDSAIAKCISLRIFLIFHQWHLTTNIGFWLGEIPWQHAFYRTRKCIVKHINNDNFVFFSIRVFLHGHWRLMEQQWKGGTIFIPLCHFHLFTNIQTFTCNFPC